MAKIKIIRTLEYQTTIEADLDSKAATNPDLAEAIESLTNPLIMPADKQEALATVEKYLFDLPEFKGEQTTDNWEPTGTGEYEVEDVEL